MRRHNRSYPRLILTLLLAWAGSAATGKPGQPPAPEATPDPANVREQSIYIPYDKLWETFEKDGRGVFLPYDKFMELWNLARSRLPVISPQVPLEPPVESVISSVTGSISMGTDVASIQARLRLDLFRRGWCRVPLRLGDVALTAAVLDGAPARLLREPDGHVLLVEHDSDTPITRELTLDFVKAFAKTPGRNRLSFAAPAAPVSHWDIRIPEPGVKIDVSSALASKPQEETAPPDTDPGDTRLRVFVGSTPELAIEWTPKAEGAKGMTALVSVQAVHEVTCEAGVVRCRAALEYDISRAPLENLAVRIPDDFRVVNVFDQNVREWSVTADANGQRIDIQLFEPARGTQSLLLELESFAAAEHVSVPRAEALGAARQQGLVVVRAGAGLRVEPGARSGLLQVDPADLPGSLARQRWDYAYRYAAIPFALSLDVTKIQPRILVTSSCRLSLSPETLQLDYSAIVEVQRAGIFTLALELPATLELREVTGLSLADATPISIENHQDLTAEDGTRLLQINLASKAQGRVALTMTLTQDLHDPRLLTPAAEPFNLSVQLPRIAPGSIERESATLLVAAPASLRLTPTPGPGLRSIPPDQALADRLLREPRLGDNRPVLAYAFRSHEIRPHIDLAVERRPPHVTVRQFLNAHIDSGVIRYTATLFVEVLYSGIETLHLAVPAEHADAIRIATHGIRHTVETETADYPGLPEDAVLWTLRGNNEFSGTQQLRLTWEQRIDTLDVGTRVTLPMPRLKPLRVDRAWGQVVLAKHESIDLAAEEASGLRPIDPRHDLMPGTAAPTAAMAYEFHDDWNLQVQAARYQAESVKATSIERSLIRMVCTRGDAISVQALYHIRSVRQRLAIVLPDGASFDTQPLRLNSRPVALEKDDRGQYLVPLVSQRHGQAFLLELRYVTTPEKTLLRLPEFPEEPAVQQVYLAAYLPEEQRYLGKHGAWNPEFVWATDGLTLKPRGKRSADNLLQWVAEGTEADRNDLLTFATDGQYLLFSTLGPSPGSAGSLRLHTTPDWLLKGLVLTLIIVIGLALLAAPWRSRALAVGIGLILYTLIAVFLPALARALVSSAAFGAVFVVLLTWLLGYLLITLPRRSRIHPPRNEPLRTDLPPPPPPAADLPEETTPTQKEGGQPHV